MVKRMKLDEFIQDLHDLAKQHFPVGKVNEFLRQASIQSEVLDAHTFYNTVRYTRNLMYKCPQFEVLLLCWGPYNASPVHGHEGEKCWMRVEEGVLHFVNYEETATHPVTLQEVSSVSGTAGFVDGPAGIHMVRNPTDQNARSLHLYARPFAQCDVYDLEAHEKSRHDISYDTMYGKPVEPTGLQQG